MKKVIQIALIILLIFTISCSKENEPVYVEKKFSKLINISSTGIIKEYKIINTLTKKEILKVIDPKPTSLRQVIDVIYATYSDKVDITDQEKLTIQVPITEDIKSFSIQIGSSTYSLPKRDTKLNIYYIDFEAPKQL